MQWIVKQYGRLLAQGQHAELCTYDVTDGTTRVLLSAAQVFEAPNWTPEGERLLFNAGGEL